MNVAGILYMSLPAELKSPNSSNSEQNFVQLHLEIIQSEPDPSLMLYTAKRCWDLFVRGLVAELYSEKHYSEVQEHSASLGICICSKSRYPFFVLNLMITFVWVIST